MLLSQSNTFILLQPPVLHPPLFWQPATLPFADFVPHPPEEQLLHPISLMFMCGSVQVDKSANQKGWVFLTGYSSPGIPQILSSMMLPLTN
jgi:hypothetical protein